MQAGGVGQAELEAHLAHARRELVEWESGRTTVRGADFERQATAASVQMVAFWLFALGRRAEADAMVERAGSAYLGWIQASARSYGPFQARRDQPDRREMLGRAR